MSNPRPDRWPNGVRHRILQRHGPCDRRTPGHDGCPRLLDGPQRRTHGGVQGDDRGRRWLRRPSPSFDITDTSRAAGRGFTAPPKRPAASTSWSTTPGFGDFGTTFLDGDPETWKGMLDVNVLALAVGSQAAVKAMRATNSEGHIINISSIAAIRRDSGVYGATKHAVNCINASLRGELEDDCDPGHVDHAGCVRHQLQPQRRRRHDGRCSPAWPASRTSNAMPKAACRS